MSIEREFGKLRALAKELIAKGQLPATMKPSLAEGSGGTGLSCELCRHHIMRDHFQYTIHVRQEGRRELKHLHFLCHAAWQIEAAEAEVSAGVQRSDDRSSRPF
jgi:hypothetical protein